jgi:tetratricopeptide (TPR) repeat protein
MNLGLSCFLQKKYAEAIDAFGACLRLKSGMDGAKLFIGISRFKLNQSSAALAVLQQYAAGHSDDFQGQYYLGLAALSLERFVEAERALEAAHQLSPEDTNVLYHLTQCYLGEARRDPSKRDEMARLYERAVARISEIDPASYRLAQLRAGAYAADGKKAEAISELETLLERDPKASGLHYTLGCLYIEQRRYDKALVQFLAEMQLDGPYPRTYMQLGHVYVEMQKPAEALPMLQRALEYDPASSGTTWVEIGRAYRIMNQPDKSVTAFQKALSSGEKNSSVYYQLAMAAKVAGNSELFRDALAKSKQLRTTETTNLSPNE